MDAGVIQISSQCILNSTAMKLKFHCDVFLRHFDKIIYI